MSYAGKIAIYGGTGNLGSYCLRRFKCADWWVANIDMNKNKDADLNILPSHGSWLAQERQVLTEMGKALQKDELDAVLCLAGGWVGGNATKNLADTTELMWRQSVWSSTIAASLATKYLAQDGLLVLTGARTALYSTPRMIGYGMAKAAVHHLTKSLGCKKSGLPKNASVVAILLDMLDTQSNRGLVPNAYNGSWTPMSFIYDQIAKWIRKEDLPPKGSLMAIITADNVSRVTQMKEEVDPSVIV